MYHRHRRKEKETHDAFCPRIFAFTLTGLLNLLGKIPQGGWPLILSSIINCVPIYTLTPRFILNIRQSYACDVQGRCGEGIDTGFGLSTSGRGSVGAETVFADVPNEGLESGVQCSGVDGMDTGLGSSSSSRSAIGTAMVCADVERDEWLDREKEPAGRQNEPAESSVLRRTAYST